MTLRRPSPPPQRHAPAAPAARGCASNPRHRVRATPPRESRASSAAHSRTRGSPDATRSPPETPPPRRRFLDASSTYASVYASRNSGFAAAAADADHCSRHNVTARAAHTLAACQHHRRLTACSHRSRASLPTASGETTAARCPRRAVHRALRCRSCAPPTPPPRVETMTMTRGGGGVAVCGLTRAAACGGAPVTVPRRWSAVARRGAGVSYTLGDARHHRRRHESTEALGGAWPTGRRGGSWLHASSATHGAELASDATQQQRLRVEAEVAPGEPATQRLWVCWRLARAGSRVPRPSPTSATTPPSHHVSRAIIAASLARSATRPDGTAGHRDRAFLSTSTGAPFFLSVD